MREKKYWIGQSEVSKAFINIAQSSFNDGSENCSKWVVDHITFSYKNIKFGEDENEIENRKFFTDRILRIFFLIGVNAIKFNKPMISNNIVDSILNLREKNKTEITKNIERIVEDAQDILKDEDNLKFLELYHQKALLQNTTK